MWKVEVFVSLTFLIYLWGFFFFSCSCLSLPQLGYFRTCIHAGPYFSVVFLSIFALIIVSYCPYFSFFILALISVCHSFITTISIFIYSFLPYFSSFYSFFPFISVQIDSFPLFQYILILSPYFSINYSCLPVFLNKIISVFIIHASHSFLTLP